MLDLSNCSKQLADSMQLAKDTGTEAQLIDKLLYLHTWYGEEHCVVELYPSLPSSPAFIDWAAFKLDPKTHKPLDRCFYNGGLVFSRSSGEWGIHS